MLKSKKIIKKKPKVKKTQKVKEFVDCYNINVFEIRAYENITNYFKAFQNYLNDEQITDDSKINTLKKILSIELYFGKGIANILEKINYQQKYLWDIPFEKFSDNQKVYDNFAFVIKVISSMLERYYNGYFFVKLLIHLKDTDSVYDAENMNRMYDVANKTILEVDYNDYDDETQT